MTIWIAEQKSLDLQKQIAMQKEELDYYKECIRHRDDEINEITAILDHVSNSSNYFALQKSKDDIQSEYNMLIKTFCDIECTF